MRRAGLALAAVLAMPMPACSSDTGAAPVPLPTNEAPMGNPVFHFEIPVTDMNRAVAFYEAVFGHRLTRKTVDGYAMAFFPRAEGQPGASGALAMGDVYRPSHDGPVIYFDVPDIEAVLARAASRGGRVLYPRKDIGAAGFVAEIEDSEGNRIALTQPKV